MKILLIANSKVVFGKELQAELNKYDRFDVYLVDFEFLTILTPESGINDSYEKEFNKYRKIPKFSMFFRMYYLKKIIQELNFDLINIHISRWFYLLILPWLKKQGLVITFYGSDFYRTSDFIKNIQKKLYTNADAITFTNPSTKKAFNDYYQDFSEKSFVCRFGLKTLEFIDANREESIERIRKELGFNKDKIIVTCGYNSTLEQNHEKIINSISLLSDDILSKVQFVFPMTYGNELVKQQIKTLLESTKLDYIVLEEYLYGKENAYIKLASDFMINVLDTDSFSGSMQEFIYAGNVVITGSWLPYKVFDKSNLDYYKIDSIDELDKKLTVLLSDKNININRVKNKEIIYSLSHWSNNIINWANVYEK